MLKVKYSGGNQKQELDILDGLLSAEQILREKNEKTPDGDTIYMRLFGGALTFKTDLMWFWADRGVGGIHPEKVAGVETDKIVKEKHWGALGNWDRDVVSHQVPELVSSLSEDKRLVILEGFYSALFHPSGRWWFYENKDMPWDVEAMVTADYDIRRKRAMRRDGHTIRLNSSGENYADWMTPNDGRDLLICTDLAEDLSRFDARIAEVSSRGKLDAGQIKLLTDFRQFSLKQIRHYEDTKK